MFYTSVIFILLHYTKNTLFCATLSLKLKIQIENEKITIMRTTGITTATVAGCNFQSQVRSTFNAPFL